MSSAASRWRLRILDEFFEIARPAFVREPASEPFDLDHGREGFVEIAVALHVYGLVREFMEDEGGKLEIAVAKHRIEHGIPQVAERRIRNRRPDVHVVTPFAEPGRLSRRTLLVEVAAIAHASGDRKAPALRLDRELLCGENIPGCIASPKVGVCPVASVVREAKFRHREIPGL